MICKGSKSLTEPGDEAFSTGTTRGLALRVSPPVGGRDSLEGERGEEGEALGGEALRGEALGGEAAPYGSGTPRRPPSAWIDARALRMAVSMPSPSTSILKKPRASMSSLSQGSTVRPSIRAGSTGATSCRGWEDNTNPPT